VAGLLVVGTVVYLMAGADVEEVQELLQASSLALPISHASVITTSSPWCTKLAYAETGSVSEITGDAPAPPPVRRRIARTSGTWRTSSWAAGYLSSWATSWERMWVR